MVTVRRTVPCTRATFASSGYAGGTFFTSIPSAVPEEILSVLPAGFGVGVTGGSAVCVAIIALVFPLGTAGFTAARVIELGFALAIAGFTGTSPVLAGGVTPRFSAETALGLVMVAGLGLAESAVLGLSAGTGADFATEGVLAFAVAPVPGVAAPDFAEATVLGLSAGAGAGFATEGVLGFAVAPVPGVAALGFAEATVLGLSAGARRGFVAAGVLGFAGATEVGLADATTLDVAGAAAVCLSVGGALGFGGETALGVAATVVLAFSAGTTMDFAPEIAPAEPAAPATSIPGFEALR
jgi:hypothetical protein